MKYIRTKDHWICKVTDEDEHTISYKNSYESGCLWKESYKNGEIKTADTIEELIDEFVCVIPNKKKPYLLDKNTNLELQVKYVGDVFGAIWTDKGLIYVAKMNDKGELELL